FLLLLVLVTIAFFAVLAPFYGAVFWGGILALLFAPVHRRIRERMPGRRNLSALATLSLILFLVILPVSLIAASLVRQATAVYGRIRSGDLDFGRYLRQVVEALPQWLRQQLDQLGLLDLAGVQERL